MSDPENKPLEAVIFDLDGVVTKTAAKHGQAWKQTFDEYLRLRESRDNEPFREFTHENDYLPFVDGKPRYEGVRSFLKSRNISLPFGQPSDPADRETVCGLGNKKNQVILNLIREEGVEKYESTIDLIRKLKEAKIRVGVASSSKNCREVLQASGIEDLFETRVDGRVSAELNLKGKPEGDIFVRAALNLGTIPAKAAVVEDAISGVQAGRNGGFGLVIGVARHDNSRELLDNGADLAVKDLSFIDIDWCRDWFAKKTCDLFSFWDQAAEPDKALLRQGIELNPCFRRSARKAFFSEKKCVFFLDYDGTLTPIVSRPELALISEEMRQTVIRLSRKYPVAVVSGRMREDVEKLVGIKDFIYAGSHGFDIAGPGLNMVHPGVRELIPVVDKAIAFFRKAFRDIKGVLIEEKKFSVAVHYRLLEDGQSFPLIEKTVNKVVADNPQLRLMQGKKVFEILPAVDWNKGKAVRWLMEALSFSWEDHSVVYIGDDTTDEDAFRAVRTRGTGILVAGQDRASAADFRISSTEEVKRLFEEVISAS